MTKTKLVFSIPEKDSPGFLLRTKRALSFYRQMSNGIQNMQESALDDLAEFLADFVEEPKDHKEAVEAIWMASEEEIQYLLAALQGGGDAEVPPEKSAN